MDQVSCGEDTINPLISREGDQLTAKNLLGAQTLMRGLEIIGVISQRVRSLSEMSERAGLTRSTTHRLATTLVEQRYLKFTPRFGYSLGPKLLELGHLASEQMSLPRIAHEHLVDLSQQTGDTVHLGVRDDNAALYLDKVQGTRRIQISSRIGERQPLSSTGLGKALLLDESDDHLQSIFQRDLGSDFGARENILHWLERMRVYKTGGYAFDLEENEDRIRCVAAPIRDASEGIIGAISISSAAQYMDDGRMQALIATVVAAAHAISIEFGWSATVKDKGT